MGEYEGKISGIGNSTTRCNEITADDLAVLRNYIYNWEYGVINRNGWSFSATVSEDKSSVIVNKGIMFAYGYFGIFPETYTIPFIKTSATQYRYIYAEIDRSVIPNTCAIKIKNNQGSDKIKPTTFRQDYLSIVKTGVFQLPLWQVKLDSTGIVELKDIRDLKDYIMKVEHAYNTTGKVTGEISPKAKAKTQLISDSSKKLATTEFVYKSTRHYIDTNNAPIYEITLVLNEEYELESFLTFIPNQLTITSEKPTTTFKAILKEGGVILDYIYPTFVSVTYIGNNEYKVELVEIPTQNTTDVITFLTTDSY